MSADFTAVVTNGLVSIKQSGDAAAGALRKVAGGVKLTSDAASEAGKKMREMGAAVARMGGPLGEVGGKLFGAAGMSGGMRALALGAVAVGVAFKAFNAVLDAGRERAQAFSDAANGMRTALLGAADARKSFEAGSADIGKVQARAENVFGKEAGGTAAMMARSFGIEQTDVLGAMAGAGTLKASHRARALEAASQAAATQEMTATEAIDMMKDPAVLAAVMTQKAGGGLSASQRGAAQLIMRRRGRSGPEALREATDTVGSAGPARSMMPGLAAQENRLTAAKVQNVTSGATEKQVSATIDKTLMPEAAAFAQFYKEQMRKVDEEREKAAFHFKNAEDKALNIFYLGSELMLSYFAEQRARKLEIATGKAVLGTGGK